MLFYVNYNVSGSRMVVTHTLMKTKCHRIENTANERLTLRDETHKSDAEIKRHLKMTNGSSYPPHRGWTDVLPLIPTA